MKHMEEKIRREVKFWKSFPRYKQRGIAFLAHTLISEIKIKDLEFFSMGWMARKMEISESHLSTCFKEVFKKPPSQVFIYYKIRLAKHLLLRRPDLRISQIAEMLDFSDGNYFIKVFKKQCKITPHQYRKKAREDRKKIFHLKRLAMKIERSLNQTIAEETNGKFENAVRVDGGLGEKGDRDLDFFFQAGGPPLVSPLI